MKVAHDYMVTSSTVIKSRDKENEKINIPLPPNSTSFSLHIAKMDLSGLPTNLILLNL